MNYVVYENQSSPTPLQHVEEPFSGLAELLSTVQTTPCHPCKGKECQHKNGLAWSPVVQEGKRADQNVRAVTALVIDIDDVTDEDAKTIATRLEGLSHIVHNSHSHRPPEKWRFRVVIELSRHVKPSEWATFYANAIGHFAFPGTDTKCKDLSRFYFLPSISESLASHAFSYKEDGATLDVDEILSLRAQAPQPNAPRVASLPVTFGVTPNPEQDNQTFTLEQLRECLVVARRSYARSVNPADRERHELVDAILGERSIATEGSRDANINKASSLLAFLLPEGVPSFVVVELMRQAIAHMPVEPEGLEKWLEKARKSYERAVKRRADARAEREAIRKAVLAKLSNAPSPEELPAWVNDLKHNKDGSLKNSKLNVKLILENGAELKEAFRFNELRKTIDTSRGPFADEHEQFLHIGLSLWLEKHYGVVLKSQDLKEMIAHTARMNSFDPLADYLNALVWDGVSRLDDVLITHFGADPDPDQNEPEFVRLVGKKWFISCVARGLKPGEYVKNVLILEGEQDIYKSTAFAVLAGAFFCDAPIRIGDKDSTMLISRSWICELAELGFLEDKRRYESAKAFISQQKDAMRPPYGSVIEDFLRRAIFVATTNRSGYLVDPTGNSRFWGVRVVLPDIAKIRADRDQLWAEAVHLYKQGVPWHFDQQQSAHAKAQARNRLELNVFLPSVYSWDQPPKTFKDAISAAEFAQKRLYMSPKEIDHGVLGKIGRAFAECGFLNKRRRISPTTLVTVYWKGSQDEQQEERDRGANTIPVSERDNQV